MDFSVREIWCGKTGRRIYGELYLPERAGKMPLVVYSHEIGYDHTTGRRYAGHLASKGVATYIFDFCGGSDNSKSEGSTYDMTVFTEVDDLGTVMGEAENWDFVDKKRTVLMGASQGGLVTAIYAGRNPDKAAAMVLLYPAFPIPVEIRKEFGSLDNVPEEQFYRNWIHSGKRYFEELWDYDTYSEIEDFTNPVLILHGGADRLVELKYSQRAVEIYADAELHVLPEAKHGFNHEQATGAIEYMDGFLERVGIY